MTARERPRLLSTQRRVAALVSGASYAALMVGFAASAPAQEGAKSAKAHLSTEPGQVAVAKIQKGSSTTTAALSGTAVPADVSTTPTPNGLAVAPTTTTTIAGAHPSSHPSTTGATATIPGTPPTTLGSGSTTTRAVGTPTTSTAGATSSTTTVVGSPPTTTTDPPTTTTDPPTTTTL